MILYEFYEFYVEFSFEKNLQVSIVGKQCRLWNFGRCVSRSTASRSSSLTWYNSQFEEKTKTARKKNNDSAQVYHKLDASSQVMSDVPPWGDPSHCPLGPRGVGTSGFDVFSGVWFGLGGLDHRMILQHPKSFDLDVMSERVFQAMTSNWIIWKGVVHFHISIVLITFVDG